MNQMNIDLTKNLANGTQLKSSITAFEQRFQQIDQEVKSCMSQEQPEVDNEYFDTRMQQLQDQITELARGKLIQPFDAQAGQSATKAKKPEEVKTRSGKLGSKKKTIQSFLDEESDYDQTPLRFSG